MLRSGKPCIVTPVWWDQNFAGDRVEALGIGKRGPHFASITGEGLAALIEEITTVPGYAQKASSIAKAIAAEPPADEVTAQRIHDGVVRIKAEKDAMANSAKGPAQQDAIAQAVNVEPAPE